VAEDVGDPINDSFDPDRVPSSRAGHNQLQAVLRRGSRGPLGAIRIGLENGRLQQPF
jgi:hypothetical protein